MSTPTGRPLYPVSVSDYAPKKVRDRAAEGQPAAGANDRSSETPKMPRQHPMEARPADDTDDDHEAPLAPAGPHEHPANRPDDGDNPPIPFKPRGAREDGAERTDSAESGYDPDLDRLESSLNQIRRELDEIPGRSPRASTEAGDEPRLPRASQLPPVPGLRAPADGRDNYIDGFRLPRSLGPTYVPPLREKRTNHLGLALRVAVACAIAAPAAYYLAAGSGSKSDRGPKLSAAGTRIVDLPPMPAPSPAVAQQGGQALPPQAQILPAQPLPPQGLAPKAAPVTPAPATPVAQTPASQPVVRLNDMRADATGSVVQSAPAGVAVATANPAPPRAASKPVRAVDTEAVKLLLTQGEQFVNTGDLVTARLLFRRAAEAGDADGALSLGATYDPGVLAKLGVRGIAPDVEQARSWYEKAKDLGSADAPRRLKLLANR
jgi:hypothetical protein